MCLCYVLSLCTLPIVRALVCRDATLFRIPRSSPYWSCMMHYNKPSQKLIWRQSPRNCRSFSRVIKL